MGKAEGKAKNGATSKRDGSAGANSRATKVRAVASKAKSTASALTANPIVAEIVAAALVAAAAAIKDPGKARKLAEAAGDELGAAAKGAAEGGAFWQLAMDVARRSMAELGEGSAKQEKKSKKHKKAKKKSKKAAADEA